MINHLVAIESMKRLSELKHHEVCNVDNVVYGSLTKSNQTVLQPLRRRANLHTLNHGGCVPGAQVWLGNLNRCERVYIWTFSFVFKIRLPKRVPGYRRNITGYAYDTETVWSIRSEFNIQD